uniref:Uncharacterized protein n=1 Tax=Peronospora matthiolae TaxID=2874970 RepID=A0AAV1VAZ9_9STRA
MTIDALESPEQNPAAYLARVSAPDDGVAMFAIMVPPCGQALP